MALTDQPWRDAGSAGKPAPKATDGASVEVAA
jgi:hypothetical protein